MEIQFELMYNRIVDMIELVVAVVEIDLIVKVTPIVKVELIGKVDLIGKAELDRKADLMLKRISLARMPRARH